MVFKILLARKDAHAYLLKEIHTEDSLMLKRIKRWHLDGVLIDLIFTLTLAHNSGHFVQVFVQSLLVRLAIFDIVFNYTANLNYKFLGSTAIADKIFSKILGNNGAVTKSLIFLILAVIMSSFSL